MNVAEKHWEPDALRSLDLRAPRDGMNRNLKQLVSGIPLVSQTGTLDREITSVAYDSRRVEPGALFVAMPGHHHDGGRFIQEAIEKGAVAFITEHSVGGILEMGIGSESVVGLHVEDGRHALASIASRFYNDPSRYMDVVGITGTNGKTTLTYLIESIYKANEESCGVIGSINYRFGGEVRPASMTTPEALEINAMLSEMLDAGIPRCIMEVSSHSLALKRVRELSFAVAVFTNFSRDHLDFHKTLDHYKECKKGLFLDCQVARQVINIDDAVGREIVTESLLKPLTTGIEQSADVTAENIRSSSEGLRFDLKSPYGSIEIVSQLLGHHNVHNMLSAAAVTLGQDIAIETVALGLRNLILVPGRFEKVERGQSFTVAVDYAHTDDALTNALRAARQMTPGRVIVVFGCGGDRDATKRPEMGRIATIDSDLAIITSDNPRTEDPKQIIDHIVQGLPVGTTEGKDYVIQPDRREAIRVAIKNAQAGDMVLIAGKGHEDYQILATGKVHFDDREEATEALKQRMRADGK